MSAKRPAQLTGSVIRTKGEAAPSSAAPTPLAQEKGTPATAADTKRIAVTVRLSDEEYRKLKLHGINTRKSNQDIIVEALDAFLPKEG